MKRMAKKTEVRTPKRAHAPRFSFDVLVLTKKLLAVVPERAREVLVGRFGLGQPAKRETLEAIGDRWGVTRERVRQIEAVGLGAIRESAAFRSAEKHMEELASYVTSLGGIVPEEELVGSLAPDEKTKNAYRFLLVVGSAFFRERETDDFYARWHVDAPTAEKVHDALAHLYTALKDNEVLPESELLDRFIDELKDVNKAYFTEEILKRWLSLSKTIACNPLSEWGRATCPAIRTKGIRDYAYLAMKRHGEPMHFSEVSKAIGGLFSKKAHVATTHNELIKDPRFVLVGRGLYALAEWGYTPGVVRDVIREAIEKSGPLTKEEILKRVKERRYVKDNTIAVNLADSRHFTRRKDGRYALKA